MVYPARGYADEGQGVKECGNLFFLERKNQRTFATRLRFAYQTDALLQMRRKKSFLVLLFKKEHFPSTPS
jgi:hypothetical protein